MRILIADDESSARKLLRGYLASVPDVEVVAEVASGDELEAAVPRVRPDVGLVDVRMPGRDVFAVLADLARLEVLPLVVFTTAFDRYAVRAFEINAVDFLLKPIGPVRFAEAIDRARQRTGVEGVRQVVRDLGHSPDRLLVRQGSRVRPVSVSEIESITAEGDYSRIHVDGGSHLVSKSLSQLEEILDPRRFVRIHRSTIVSWPRVVDLRAEGSGRYRVLLRSGATFVASRSYSPSLLAGRV